MKKLLIKSRLIFILTLSILLLSCRSSKESLTTSLKAQAVTITVSDSVITTGLDISTSIVNAVDSSLYEATTAQTMDVYLSPPDSSGVQYATRFTISSSTATRILAGVNYELKAFDLREQSTTAVRDSTNNRSVLSASTKETKSKKPPSVVPFAILLGMNAVVLMCIRYWKPLATIFKRIKSLLKL